MNKYYEEWPIPRKKWRLLMLDGPPRRCSSSRCIQGLQSWWSPPAGRSLASVRRSSARSRRSMPNFPGSRMSLTEKAVTREAGQADGGDLVARGFPGPSHWKLLVRGRYRGCLGSFSSDLTARGPCRGSSSPSDGDLATRSACGESTGSRCVTTSSSRSVAGSTTVSDVRSRSDSSSSVPDGADESSKSPVEVLGGDLFEVGGLPPRWVASTIIAWRWPAPGGSLPSPPRRQVTVSLGDWWTVVWQSQLAAVTWSSAGSESWFARSSIWPVLNIKCKKRRWYARNSWCSYLRHAVRSAAFSRAVTARRRCVQPTSRRCRSRSVIGRRPTGTCSRSEHSQSRAVVWRH